MSEDYFVFGLRVRSELVLPELGPAGTPEADAPVITVQIGSAGREIEKPSQVGPTFQVGMDDYLLEVRNVARYRVRRGNEIVVEPAAGSTERDVRLFLFGTVLGALCHQRGLLPLHASAIVANGRAIAFSGHSRAGKSTLAAFFADRGYPVLADDLCVLTFEGDRRPTALTGTRNIKLWQDALDKLGRDSAALQAVRAGLQKYQVPLNGSAALAASPLDRIYILHEARLPQHQGIKRLSGAGAFGAIFNHTYRPRLIAPLGHAQANFARCVALLQRVPVFALGRSWGFAGFARDAAALEAHFLDPDATASPA